MTEWYWCASCEAEDCEECALGFTVWEDERDEEPECPCCGSLDVAP